MKQTRSFGSGVLAFALIAICSVVAAAVLWLTASAGDFTHAAKSWNCEVSQAVSTFFGPTFCFPQPLQIAIMALAVSCIGLLLFALSDVVVRDWGSDHGTGTLLVRFLLAATVVGAIIDLEMFVVGYALDYRGPLVFVAMLLAALIVGKFMFPEIKPLFLAFLTLPLAIIGFFFGIMIAAMAGIPFD